MRFISFVLVKRYSGSSTVTSPKIRATHPNRSSAPAFIISRVNSSLSVFFAQVFFAGKNLYPIRAANRVGTVVSQLEAILNG
jgi:hypothetical protein